MGGVEEEAGVVHGQGGGLDVEAGVLQALGEGGKDEIKVLGVWDLVWDLVWRVRGGGKVGDEVGFGLEAGGDGGRVALFPRLESGEEGVDVHWSAECRTNVWHCLQQLVDVCTLHFAVDEWWLREGGFERKLRAQEGNNFHISQ